MVSGIGVELPLVRLIGSWIPLEACRRLFASPPFLMTYGTKAIRGSKQRGDTAKIFAKIIKESEKERGGDLGEKDVVIEATGLIVVGSDTTGITLTYLVWAALSRPQLKDDLQKELSALPQNYTDQGLEDLPLLNAVIDETLRLYGAAPDGLPRRTSPGGAQPGGYNIPRGTTVTTQAYTIHCDETIFEDALNFDPFR